MTVLESRPDAPPVESERPRDAGSPAAVRTRSGARRVFATAVIALVVVIVVWGAFELFEGPVAQTWYRTRQHQLASQLAASRAHTGRGAAIAVLQIPRIGINLLVAEGDSPQQLRSGPGHRMGTPLPGDVGNSVIVGHQSGWGGPLRNADMVKAGDLIVVQTLGPRNGVFKVVSVQRASASDVTPFGRSTDRRLTIVTGTGGQFSDRRLVITAVSGTVGSARPAAPGTISETPAGSRLWNSQMLLALGGIGGALFVVLLMRRRYRPAIVALPVVPLLVLGVLGLFANLDLFLAPLR